MSNYTIEQINLLKECLSEVSLNGDKLNSYTGKVYKVKYKINNVFEEGQSLYVNLLSNENRTKTYKLRVLLEQLGDGYKTTNKFILGLKKYVDNNKGKKFGPTLREYLDAGVLQLENVEIYQDEIDWLNKHVRRIRALVPTKLSYVFKKNFPGQTCEERKDQWAFGFSMFFDEVDDIPDTLLQLKNKNGNSIDLDNKTFNNTSYIWKLLKAYPEMFEFGKRDI